ncbi:MAG: nitroreductase [Candidatus Omnitrophota bacterium]|jgi:nitroreductase
MDIIDAIRQRRSVRVYTKDMPKDSDIEKVLEAARWAPSGLNNQPWRFLVLKGGKKDNLAQFTKYGKIIQNAPVAIAVFMDTADSYNRDKDLMAMGAAIQNLLLEAHSIGLAACWLGEILNKKDEVCKSLGQEPDLELTAVVVLGYSDEDITQAGRKALKSLILK